MSRFLILIYGIIAYLAFFFTISYMIGFVSCVIVPKCINTGTPGPFLVKVAIDIGLVLLFGVSHSVMARPAFKKQLTKIIPPAAERSTFVLVASLSLFVLYRFWQSIPIIFWDFYTPISWVLFFLSMAGWVIVFWSTFLIDHFDLFGLRQVWLNFRGIEYSAPPFVVRGIYKYVRHPLMLGFLLAFWCTPMMTVGHLLFAITMTIYIFIGISHEERDLARVLGDDYAEYKAQTPLIFPRWPFKKS